MNIRITKGKRPEYSKQLVSDIRALLWVVTVGGLALAAYCIREGYTGSLPWVSAMVGLPWTAHGVVCSFYLNMAKSDHIPMVLCTAATAMRLSPLWVMALWIL